MEKILVTYIELLIVVTSLDKMKNIFFQGVSWLNMTTSIIRFLVDWTKMGQ